MMKVTIIGCAYVGTAVARSWSQQSDLIVTATITTPERIAALEAIAQKVVVVKGNDPVGLQSVLQEQDPVLLSVDEQTYLETAQTLVSVLEHTPTLRQLIYTGSLRYTAIAALSNLLLHKLSKLRWLGYFCSSLFCADKNKPFKLLNEGVTKVFLY